MAAKVITVLALMLLPTTFIGMTLPFASAASIDTMASLGKKVGTVFSINTLGTIVGSVCAGFTYSAQRLTWLPWFV